MIVLSAVIWRAHSFCTVICKMHAFDHTLYKLTVMNEWREGNITLMVRLYNSSESQFLFQPILNRYTILTQTWQCDISIVDPTSPGVTSAHTGSAPCWGAVGGTGGTHSRGRVNVFIHLTDCRNEKTRSFDSWWLSSLCSYYKVTQPGPYLKPRPLLSQWAALQLQRNSANRIGLEEDNVIKANNNYVTPPTQSYPADYNMKWKMASSFSIQIILTTNLKWQHDNCITGLSSLTIGTHGQMAHNLQNNFQ